MPDEVHEFIPAESREPSAVTELEPLTTLSPKPFVAPSQSPEHMVQYPPKHRWEVERHGPDG